MFILTSLSWLRRTVTVLAGLAVLAVAAWSTFGYPTGSGVPVARAAQADYFLKIEGIDGESSDPRNQGAIQLESWSWGESKPGIVRSVSGGGGGAGKASFSDLSFTSGVSKATPKLMLAAANGKHFPKATLMVRKAGGEQQEYYTITLSNVMVSSYATGGSGTSAPTEQFSLNFTKIEFEYKPQNADGTTGSPIKAGWDLKMNKGI